MTCQRLKWNECTADRLAYFVSIIVSLLVCYMLFGCQSVPDAPAFKVTEGTVLHANLLLTINGQKIVGTGVVNVAPQYTITVYPPGKIDRIVWRTCAQEHYDDKPSTGWRDNKYTFILQHSEVEKTTACGGLDIEVLESKTKRNSLAFIDFRGGREEMALGSLLECNGSSTREMGAGVCDAARGLISQITFNQPVIQRGVVGTCDVMRPLDGNESLYRFEVPTGRCVYYFVAQEKAPNGERNTFRLTTIGYTDIPITE